MNKKTVSLVLGSGGARGLAHIGIIRYLEEHNYEIRSISGCSIGSLVGGFYAAGKLEAYESWLESLDIFEMLKLLDFKGSGGFVSGEKLMAKLQDILGEHDIENLPINFTAVAADISEEKEVWMNKGSLIKAIRASISLPMFFTPYHYKGKILVDGGVLNPVPIAPTFHDATDITIAVNLGGDALYPPPLELQEEPKSFSMKMQEYVSKLSIPDAFVKEDGIYVIANKSFDTMQGALARMKLAAYHPDVEITLPRNLCGTFEFHKAKEIIEYGYNACKTIEELRR